MDTLIIIAAFCALTDQPADGWLAIKGDTVHIHTNLHSEKSAVVWHSTTTCELRSGVTLTLKPANRFELYDRNRFLVLGAYQDRYKLQGID